MLCFEYGLSWPNSCWNLIANVKILSNGGVLSCGGTVLIHRWMLFSQEWVSDCRNSFLSFSPVEPSPEFKQVPVTCSWIWAEQISFLYKLASSRCCVIVTENGWRHPVIMETYEVTHGFHGHSSPVGRLRHVTRAVTPSVGRGWQERKWVSSSCSLWFLVSLL